MITKLRRKMILMVMGVVTVLLLSIFLILYRSAASGFETRSMETLRNALEQQREPEPQRRLESQREAELQQESETSQSQETAENPPEHSDVQKNQAPPAPKSGTLAPPEGREERPILVLEKQPDGTIRILKNTVYTSETPNTENLISRVEASGREFGKLTDEHLRFLKDHTAPDKTERYAFGDTYSEEQSLQHQLTASLLIGAGAFLIFLIFAVWFSGWAVKPVEEAWKRQRQFAADASHELKTPLTVILSNAGLIAVSPKLTDPEDQRRVGYIQTEAKRMKQLVEELLFLARSDAGRLAAEKKDIDLSFLIESCALTFEPVAFDQGKQIATDIEPGLILEGEEQKLKQLAEILLDNACKYSDSGSTIRVSLKQGGTQEQGEPQKRGGIQMQNGHNKRNGDKKLRLTVSSQGTPLTKEEQKQIFERFYRADPSRGNVSGYGLGLAIAQEIVRLHGGKIWAESDGEKENRFIAEF